MTDKTFNIVGTSKFKEVVKVRFANGDDIEARKKVLERGEHTEIKLYQLPKSMTKDQAREWLTSEHPSIARAVTKKEKPAAAPKKATAKKADKKSEAVPA